MRKDEIAELEVSSLIPYARNNKTHNRKQLDKLKAVIKEHGYDVYIVVDEDNVILKGHGRHEVITELGWDKVKCIKRYGLTKTEKKAIRIEDNKIAELAEWDNEMLALELKDLADVDFDIETLGFDMEEVEALDNLLDRGLEDANNVEHVTLADKFVVPPFSILDSRQGYWIERKRMWKSLINDKGESREMAMGSKSNSYGTTSKNLKYAPEVSILDPVLSEIIYKWFGRKDCKVFDCFSGDSVFGYVSSYLGGAFTGIELREEQVELNNIRIEGYKKSKYICDDGRNILKYIKENSQDLLFSCPPYYDLEVYSDKENDASNQETYEDFYKILDSAFVDSIKCLKENRFAVVVAGEVRDKKGFYYKFLDDIRSTFTNNGMGMINELIYLEMLGTVPQRANKQMKHRKVPKVHQNVLVFYKGDPKEIKNIFEEIEVLEVESEDME